MSASAEQFAEFRARRKNPGGKGTKKKSHTKITKRKFLKALKGTAGVVARIAKRMGCNDIALRLKLRSPDWEDMRRALIEEEDRLVDTAKIAVEELIEQNDDLPEKGRNARYILDRRAGVVPSFKVTLEGGENPLRLQGALEVNALPLSVEMKRALLEAVEQHSKKQKQNPL